MFTSISTYLHSYVYIICSTSTHTRYMCTLYVIVVCMTKNAPSCWKPWNIAQNRNTTFYFNIFAKPIPQKTYFSSAKVYIKKSIFLLFFDIFCFILDGTTKRIITHRVYKFCFLNSILLTTIFENMSVINLYYYIYAVALSTEIWVSAIQGSLISP